MRIDHNQLRRTKSGGSHHLWYHHNQIRSALDRKWEGNYYVIIKLTKNVWQNDKNCFQMSRKKFSLRKKHISRNTIANVKIVSELLQKKQQNFSRRKLGCNKVFGMKSVSASFEKKSENEIFNPLPCTHTLKKKKQDICILFRTCNIQLLSRHRQKSSQKGFSAK